VVRRLAAAAAAMALTLLLAAPALANDVHQSNISSDDAAFQGTDTDCAGLNLQPGQILWHFVHVGTDSTDLPSTLTATFTKSGTLTATGYVNGSSIVMYDITTSMGAETFVTGSDTITTDPITEPLNLSHICNGGPPPDVPEAPASVLLLLTAGLLGAGFVGWRMRRGAQTTA
jgi:hypothetical protein